MVGQPSRIKVADLGPELVAPGTEVGTLSDDLWVLVEQGELGPLQVSQVLLHGVEMREQLGAVHL